MPAENGQSARHDEFVEIDHRERLAQVAAEIAAGRTDLAAVIGVTDDELEAVYALGYRLYSAGKYAQSLEFFRFLCVHRHCDARFWFGFGAASQMLDDPANAVHAYGLAGLFNSDDPQIPLRAAECFIKLDRPADAVSALEGVLAVNAGKPEQSTAARRAQLMLRRLRSKARGKGNCDA